MPDRPLTLVACCLSLLLFACGEDDSAPRGGSAGSGGAAGEAGGMGGSGGADEGAGGDDTGGDAGAGGDEPFEWDLDELPQDGDPVVPERSYGQKGPFRPGATVTASRLLADGSLSEDDRRSGITAGNGEIFLPPLPWSGATHLLIEGRSFDEVAGVYGDDDIRLEGLLTVEDGELRGNVNLLTHLLSYRARALLQEHQGDEGFGWEEAKEQAIEDLDTWFSVDIDPSELNFLFQADVRQVLRAPSAELLLLSAAFSKLGYGQQELDRLAEAFAGGFGEGVEGFELYEAMGALAYRESEELLETARQNLADHFGADAPLQLRLFDSSWLLNGCHYLSLGEENPPRLCLDRPRIFRIPANNRQGFAFTPPHGGYYQFSLPTTDSSVDPWPSTWWAYPGWDEERRFGTGTNKGGCDLLVCGDAMSNTVVGWMNGGTPSYILYTNRTDEELEIEVTVRASAGGNMGNPIWIPFGERSTGIVGRHENHRTSYYTFDVPARYHFDESGTPIPSTPKTRIAIDDTSCSGQRSPTLRLYEVQEGPPIQRPLIAEEGGQSDCAPVVIEEHLKAGTQYILELRNERMVIFGREPQNWTRAPGRIFYPFTVEFVD